MFKLLFPVLFFRMSFLGGLIGGIGSVVGGLFGMEGQKDANDTNAQLARENREWMSGENKLQREFNSAEAALNRDFQADESRIARDYSTEMSNTQYLRAVRDMRNAGLNPMLLAGKAAGATTPSTSVPAGAAASATSVGAPSMARMENAFASAVQATSGIAQVARAFAETENIKAQNANIRAQTANINADTGEKIASTGLKNVQSDLVTKETSHTAAKIDKVFEEIGLLRQSIITSGTSAEKNRKMTELLNYQLPRAINEAESESTWFKKHISPFLPDILKSSTIMRGLTK